MDCPAVALFRQRLEASMPSQQIEEMRCCTGAPYMDCVDLAFDSFILRAVRNHVKQLQNESKALDAHICNLSIDSMDVHAEVHSLRKRCVYQVY